MSSLDKVGQASIMSIKTWAKTAPKGEMLLYHRGLLMRDRQASEPLNEVAHYIYVLASKGMITLNQNRIGEGDYQYFAVKN